MSQLSFDVYLFFAGDCRTAMEFYKGIFGGELTIQTRGEVDPSAPEDMKDKIIHANLEGGEIKLMASDNMEPGGLGRGKIALTLSSDDEAKMRPLFDALSAGGEVISPLKVEFWGDTFGALRDKYNVDWMINIAKQA